LQGETIQDDETRKKLAEMQSRIKTIALVHEKLYKESNIKTVEFSDYIITLVGMIQRLNESSKDRIKLFFDLEKNDITIEKALPLGLILNELITNAYKHAFVGRNNGEIELKFQLKDNIYYLAVKDNGVGFQGEKDTNLDSLGLTLVETLSDQIDAKYTVKSEQGTTYEFWFK
jgi:two-component system, sensor histidine kinase PdtaS